MNLTALHPFHSKNKIRVGKKKDGGYVIEETSASKAKLLYSYGVGWDISFEVDLNKKFGIPFRLFDPSMFSIQNIYPIQNNNFIGIIKTLIKILIWPLYFAVLKLTGVKFSFLKQGLSTKTSPRFATFKEHLMKYGDLSKNILLKIDIEENEYDLFENQEFLESLSNVIQILIEFHNAKNRINEIIRIIHKIGGEFSLIHIHGNNYDTKFNLNGIEIPNALELTFVRNEFLPVRELDQESYPIKNIDFPNDPSKEDYNLNSILQNL